MYVKYFLRLSWGLCALVFLVGCSTDVQKIPFYSLIEYPNHRIPLNVAHISFKNNDSFITDDEAQRPFYGNLAFVVERWLKSRFQAAGTSGEAIVSIENIRVIQKGLNQKGLFNMGTNSSYGATIKIKVAVQNSAEYKRAQSITFVEKIIDVDSFVNLDFRQPLWITFTQNMLHTLDIQMLADMKKYMEKIFY